MTYYVRRVCRKTALMITVDLENTDYDFSVEITLFFRNIADTIEMFNLLLDYMKSQQSIEARLIFTVYEYLRTHEKSGESK